MRRHSNLTYILHSIQERADCQKFLLVQGTTSINVCEFEHMVELCLGERVSGFREEFLQFLGLRGSKTDGISDGWDNTTLSATTRHYYKQVGPQRRVRVR